MGNPSTLHTIPDFSQKAKNPGPKSKSIQDRAICVELRKGVWKPVPRAASFLLQLHS